MSRDWTEPQKEVWFNKVFGWVPSQNELIAWAKHDPGAVELVINILNPHKYWRDTQRDIRIGLNMRNKKTKESE